LLVLQWFSSCLLLGFTWCSATNCSLVVHSCSRGGAILRRSQKSGSLNKRTPQGNSSVCAPSTVAVSQTSVALPLLARQQDDRPSSRGGLRRPTPPRVLTHAAFRGQTPDEKYFGAGDWVPAALTSGAAAARRAHAEANRISGLPDMYVARRSRMTTDRLCDRRAGGLVRLGDHGRENPTMRSVEHTAKSHRGQRLPGAAPARKRRVLARERAECPWRQFGGLQHHYERRASEDLVRTPPKAPQEATTEFLVGKTAKSTEPPEFRRGYGCIRPLSQPLKR
jgi:hypothetical protein